MTLRKTLIGASVAAALTSTSSFATDLDSLQKQIDELKAENSQILANLESTSDSYSGSNATTIGGYGELHYNNLSSDLSNTDKKSVDFHRFVLFFAHEFNDDIRFFSEFELEHALVKDTDDGSNGGEVELEQAYIEFDTSDNSNVKAGVFLIPVGQMNETHEPPAFYGVERNPVEKNIIPATWWEAGAMYSAHTDNGISYDLAIHSGLADNSGSVRSGRQKVSKAAADSLAYTARIKYTGITGLELAGTAQYQSDFSQGTGTTGDAEDGTLLEAHAVYTTGGLKLSALYANWDINFDGGTTTGKDSQNGSIVEASYKLNSKWGVFARQNNWTNDDGATDKAQSDFGFNYWPHEDVVLKADYQAQNDDAGDFDGINLGIGYQF
ncbi:MAG: porin [endosymbiont of Galathealinum brachiosum]|uniref:Porin n=1 Tax=endosymbiont of Galathealinum brachiosum TaxID=2200906 RepID=A0A370DAR5_9GAMM|nr:MAG: porin [endosymbiont of Galathealinum brachiosum]